MTAEICGDTVKTLNAYQYTKYLWQQAFLYNRIKRFANSTDISLFLADTPREIMEVKFNLTVTDRKFDLTNTLVFEYSMKMDETRPHRGIKTFFWKTHSVKVGGVCPQEGGALVYRPIETTVADFEEFKNHPTARTLLGFFTPLSYQFTDPEQKQIPSFWMTGLEKDRSEMYVCQDPQKEPVKYTEEQFLSWYHRFGIMWHAEKDKEEDFASISVQKIEDNKIVAIVTMKLQIGINPINMGWNFRVSGVKNPEVDNGERWYIEKVEVICHPDYNAKDEAAKALGNILAEAFVQDLMDLEDPTQWLSTVNKNPDIDLFVFDRNIRHIKKFSKYYVPDQAVFSPALDSNTVTFKTISQAERNGIETEYENEWKFDVKWDKVDQFYYVEQMKIGCHEKIVDGNYGPTARYADIDYGVP